MKNYSFRLIKPFNSEKKQMNEAIDMRNSIFFAGPCPRKDYEKDWRFEAYDILSELCFTGTVITPTNDLYKSMSGILSDSYKAQTSWERTMMHMASVIVFWVPRSEEYPGLTTNVEFGEWYKSPGVFFGYPETSSQVRYLKTKFQEQGKKSYNDLRSMLTDVVAHLAPMESERRWFTADTHWCQKRTLELSRRPFKDITEMDLTMISNWNKTVAPDGIVYHAGDFIDPEKINELPTLLSNLNYKELHWVLGNYDRKMKPQIDKIVESINDGRKIYLYDKVDAESICRVTLDNKKFVVIHEPVTVPAANEKDTTYLYGHIHGRAFAKRNGFDLASDYHRYTPISEEEVLWFKNDMQYWNENVYSDHIVTV